MIPSVILRPTHTHKYTCTMLECIYKQYRIYKHTAHTHSIRMHTQATYGTQTQVGKVKEGIMKLR